MASKQFEGRGRGFRGRSRGGVGGFRNEPSADRLIYEQVAAKRSRPIDNSEKELFLNYQQELDERHDKQERLVKISRDITIESKRIIFFLHRYPTMKTDDQRRKHLEAAKGRIDDLINNKFAEVARELDVVDQHLYIKSIWGLEEFIEAWSFYKFIAENDLLYIDEIIKALRFDREQVEQKDESEQKDEQQQKDEPQNKLFVQLAAEVYLLGLGDLGGELMRFAISQVSAGNPESAKNVVDFMRRLYACYVFLGCPSANRDYYVKKVQTLRQSLIKVENSLYDMTLRKSEFPESAGFEMMSFGAPVDSYELVSEVDF